MTDRRDKVVHFSVPEVQMLIMACELMATRAGSALAVAPTVQDRKIKLKVVREWEALIGKLRYAFDLHTQPTDKSSAR